ARDFIEHKYDIRHLERTILQSRTYQLSSLPSGNNRTDRRNHSHAPVRRLMAEVVIDVLHGALGVTENFGPEVPPGIHPVEIGRSRLQSKDLAYLFRIFNRPVRAAQCDCERSAEPALPQTLFLMTDPDLLKKIGTGRLKKLLEEKKTDEQIVEELF